MRGVRNPSTRSGAGVIGHYPDVIAHPHWVNDHNTTTQLAVVRQRHDGQTTTAVRYGQSGCLEARIAARLGSAAYSTLHGVLHSPSAGCIDRRRAAGAAGADVERVGSGSEAIAATLAARLRQRT